MARRPRRPITEGQMSLLWECWQKGESLHQIARLLDRRHSSIRRVLAQTAGIRPAPRHRAMRALTLAEREEISRSVALGHSLRAIASQLHRAPSTISRELKRNGGHDIYGANHADERAWVRACRPKICKLKRHRVLAKLVAAKLQRRWSPVQIAGWLKQRAGDDEEQRMSLLGFRTNGLVRPLTERSISNMRPSR